MSQWVFDPECNQLVTCPERRLIRVRFVLSCGSSTRFLHPIFGAASAIHFFGWNRSNMTGMVKKRLLARAFLGPPWDIRTPPHVAR